MPISRCRFAEFSQLKRCSYLIQRGHRGPEAASKRFEAANTTLEAGYTSKLLRSACRFRLVFNIFNT